MIDVDSILLAAKTTFFLLWQMLCYLFGRKRIDCIRKIATFLSSYNIVYSKTFQSLSSGADLLTNIEMEYLSRFNDNVPYLEEELPDLDELEEQINKDRQANRLVIERNPKGPEASGMIALVYYGTLGNKDVVIKVKRKNIDERLHQAIDKMRLLVKISTWLPYLRRMNLYTVFEENESDMYKQVLFKKEADNLSKMGLQFANTDYVKIPWVDTSITESNNNVIVMERLRGKKLKQLDNNEKNDYGLLVAQYSLKSVLYDKMYHADLHSGNILFMEEETDEIMTKKLGIIDFGIVGEISREEQEDFTEFFIKMFLKDEPTEAAKIIASRLVAPSDVYNSMSKDRKELLYKDMAETINNIVYNSEVLNVMTIYKINKLLFNYNLTLSRPFCRIQLSLAVSASVSNELCNNGETYIDHIKKTMDKMNNTTTCIMEY
ncbi:MAG: hypothetical protein CMI79_01760 [Candidatus Pelagibacter sp.]|nr:hypothetical protein [Candidatus Pelagibacter sp.]|tara:strand:- start:3279 stop:4580 length:1302 start_codon:yes stop_codon:yes gene_type:complete